MKFRGFSSSSRTSKTKSPIPFSISLSSSHHDAAARRFCGGFIDSPPSQTELHDSLASLQRVLGLASRVELHRDMYCNKPEKELSHVGRISEGDSETDWIEPFLFPCDPKMLQENGSDRVYHAIHLLQTDPSVQRLVKSLSTDAAVWEAVLNNEVVQELRETISADQEHKLRSLDEIANDDPDKSTNVLISLLITARTKFMEVIEKITKIMISLFQQSFNKKDDHTEDSQPLIEKLRAAFMLSIMVLLIVVVRRVQR
ncbi:unnamed protein product [Vicia faba]|uniref:Uncharacterized protein n=1 Tax=Vicia faba TaxID=3906 RepID=A0AAV0ZWV3_VICFA|nr:unnamed protein product [Vicia faba]